VTPDNAADDGLGAVATVVGWRAALRRDVSLLLLFKALALASSDHAGGRCPFYSTCDLDLRTAHPDVCRDAPWRIYARAGRQGTCFYGAAVGGLLGLAVQ